MENAEADLHGELLRVRASAAEHLSRILEVLDQLGFPAELAGEDVGDRSWYGLDRVGELSQAEGRIIAARVVAPFAREHELDAQLTATLVDQLARALHRCFISDELAVTASAVTMRAACKRAAALASQTLLGAALADALAEAVEADLALRGTGGADRS